jgi:hemolysin activation/secretion protein
MNLSNDPSILATLNNSTLNSSSLNQPPQEEVNQDNDDSSKKKEKKKKKAKEPKEPRSKEKGPRAAKSSGGNEIKNSLKQIAVEDNLEAQLESDMAAISDNILHTKWMMATELKERGKERKKLANLETQHCIYIFFSFTL